MCQSCRRAKCSFALAHWDALGSALALAAFIIVMAGAVLRSGRTGPVQPQCSLQDAEPARDLACGVSQRMGMVPLLPGRAPAKDQAECPPALTRPRSGAQERGSAPSGRADRPAQRRPACRANAAASGHPAGDGHAAHQTRCARCASACTAATAASVISLRAGAAPRTGTRRWPLTRSGFPPRRASGCAPARRRSCASAGAGPCPRRPAPARPRPAGRLRTA